MNPWQGWCWASKAPRHDMRRLAATRCLDAWLWQYDHGWSASGFVTCEAIVIAKAARCSRFDTARTTQASRLWPTVRKPYPLDDHFPYRARFSHRFDSHADNRIAVSRRRCRADGGAFGNCHREFGG